MKAAILLLHIGGGHMEAAQNVKAALEEQHPGIEVRIIDGLEHTFQWFARFFRWWWYTVQNVAPGVWGWMYESPLFASSFFSWWMYHAPWWGMRRILREWQPDMVFATHFVGIPVAAKARKQAKLDMKINYIVTEYIWHDEYFVWPEADRYYMSLEMQKQKALEHGILEDRISLTGIPIKKVFEDQISREQARDKLEIPQDATVLFFFAGTLGGTAIDQLVESIKGKDVYPVVVCGKNEEVKANIEGLLEKAGIDGKVYGFVDFMNVIMRAADFMVGKGGALMCAECLATGCPVLLYGSPPGHELGNALYLEEIGGGIVTEKIEDVLREIDRLLKSPEELTKMSEALLARAQPAAARQVAELALRDRLEGRASAGQLEG